ncbi:hypothetical protein HG536_0B05980 [Torulaspora globosa]|uniref:Transcription factor IIIC putative zinc-finger domain-containing protein n=1 Tax=Torulaspora globosa TaxID=48254 RepID=A0A7G3ZDZ6_9SACH|nr:uncharacterized protein HG536_0B05980 [Torulaspora globosa]QLL31732.1 hypothetical protein HG536_0B05980 [Torulaspora globosa]
MKLLKDLVITRKELQDSERNIVWARDGTLYITAYPDICIGQPIYRKEVSNNSKQLFHIKDYPLELENKFEFEGAGRNALLNSQPVSYTKLCKPCPTASFLAVLTSNLNVHIFKDQRLICNLDEPDKELERRAYHCVEWSPDGSSLAVGNERGEVVIYSLEDHADGSPHFTANKLIELGHDVATNWIVGIDWKDDKIIIMLDNNSIYMVDFSKGGKLTRLRAPSRLRLIDSCLLDKFLVYTDSCHLYRVDLEAEETSSLALTASDGFKIVPVKGTETVIVISNKTSCKVQLKGELTLAPDEIVAPHLERKFKKWSIINNEFSNYEASVLIHGLALSSDGYSLAICYSMERATMKYKIASEHMFYITFVPLCHSWTISKYATGLAWYQCYQIYQCTLPSSASKEDIPTPTCDVNMSLRAYIRSLLNNEKMNSWRFFNFIDEHPSIVPFRRAIFDYAVAKSSEITNPIDKASIQSLASILRRDSPVTSDIVELRGEFITESFDFRTSDTPDYICSEQQHTWRRCFVSLLPILTTQVKVCPISNQRIIDIKKDNLNDYGWFTRTLLEELNEESVYTGTAMAAA